MNGKVLTSAADCYSQLPGKMNRQVMPVFSGIHIGDEVHRIEQGAGRMSAWPLENSHLAAVEREPFQNIARQSFIAESCEHTFRIGVSNDVEYALLPHLLCKLRAEAPGICIQVIRAEDASVDAMLAQGDICINISLEPCSSSSANRQVLRVSPTTVLRADTIPGALTVADFCARPHVDVAFSPVMNAYIDKAVNREGYSRRVAMSIGEFNALPALLARTDGLAVVPDYVASALVMKGGLRAETVPFSHPEFSLSMYWGPGKKDDPAETWLRSRCKMMLAAY